MKSSTGTLIATLISLCLLTPAVSAEVSVSGLAGQEKDNVLLTLSLAKQPCDAPEWKVRRLFE